ncbi:MAG: hypothetical protein ACYCXY_09335 [Acidimicrobiales bacterium]
MTTVASSAVVACDRRHLGLFEVRRSDIETFGRELEAKRRATATIARRPCTVTGFYCYAETEDLIAALDAGAAR